MPAVNIPLQETLGNVTSYPVPGSQLRLLYRIPLTFLGFILLGVLFLVHKRRYKSRSRNYASQVNPSAPTQKRWISEKAYQDDFWGDIMSVNHPSGISQLRATENVSEGKKARGRDGSKERDNREGPQREVTTSVSIDAGMFAFQDRRPSAPASCIGDLDSNFFQQPNPDYTLSSESSESTSTALPHDHDSPSIPRRRSYTKVLPLGPAQPDSEHDGGSFSPSSFPSSSAILPLAPHESLESRDIDVKGEIISVMDDSGAGWKRHTRVYGGGVCLACLASGSQGGFYGDNVPPEHRR